MTQIRFVPRPPRRPRPGRRPHGFTLVELIVALALGVLISLAALAALLSAQRGYAGVDTGAQLRDNTSFAVDLIQRLALQTGYQDLTSPNVMSLSSAILSGNTPSPMPAVTGYNNARVTLSSLPSITGGSRSDGCPTDAADPTACANGSDVLVLRFYGINDANPSATTGDGSMIDCAGNVVPPLTGSVANRAWSIFYVATDSNGEPTLMCATNTTGSWMATPLVSGVESFQVLYGVDDVTPGASGSPGTPHVPTFSDNPLYPANPTVPPTLQWLRADQIGSGTSSYAAWYEVRRIRIGLLLRGPPNTAVDKASTAATWYPLGYGNNHNGGYVGLGSSSDPGTELTTIADGRVRRTLSFTIYLRNPNPCPGRGVSIPANSACHDIP